MSRTYEEIMDDHKIQYRQRKEEIEKKREKFLKELNKKKKKQMKDKEIIQK